MTYRRLQLRARTLLAAATILAGAAMAATPAHAGTDETSCTEICVLDTRAGSHPGFDRLVFDFSTGTLPGTVTATASSDGSYSTPSGETKKLEIAGQKYLILDISGAHAHDDSGAVTYAPGVKAVNLPSLRGIQLLSDFEGHIQFGLSLATVSHYKTFTLANPNRLVVDLYR
ncbi:hypothetical protein ABZV60_16860 [Streptomyces sp. NPDC004787]|uniref:AMIN-like domain-containing (lipo)protein n=1 Tax=Streptomyces sp. NPDC004787 TaxID=3154291 RepID=UPI00339E1D3F